MTIRKEDALEYHASPAAGKLSVTPTKPCRTQRDLSLAYSPGVAVPCKEIERDPGLAYKYTAKGNLVAAAHIEEVGPPEMSSERGSGIARTALL